MSTIAPLIRPLIDSKEKAETYLLHRNRFAAELAGRLVGTSRLTRTERTPILYAVWLHGHTEPVYLGQSSNGYRRLWDLPIGESHHLANTFPPECWRSVDVLRWTDLMGSRLEEFLAQIANHFGVDRSGALKIGGLGFEFLFLVRLQPLFNMRKRERNGELRVVDLVASRSQGALASSICNEFADKIVVAWEHLAATENHHSNAAFRISV